MVHYLIAYSLTLILSEPLTPLGAAATTVGLGAVKEHVLDTRPDYFDHLNNMLGAGTAVIVVSF